MGSLIEELQKEAFSQSCQMYRHFSLLRYYTFVTYGAVTAALATLHFVQLPSISDQKKLDSAAGWIRKCGIVVPLVCLSFDLMMTEIMKDYRQKMAEYTEPLGEDGFVISVAENWSVTGMRVAAVCVYAISVVAWARYAVTPSYAGKTPRDDQNSTGVNSDSSLTEIGSGAIPSEGKRHELKPEKSEGQDERTTENKICPGE